MEQGSFPRQLSASQQAIGKRFFRRFVTINGVAVAFLIDDMLILYGIRNGLSDPQLAFLASFIHLTMPFMIIGKLLIQHHGAAKTWSNTWTLRYVAASTLILAPFLQKFDSQWLTTSVILFGGFSFAVFRAIGHVANSPLQGEITTVRDRGKFIAGNVMRAQSLYIVSMLSAILILRYYDAIWVYQIIIGMGCVAGIYSSRQLANIPESRTPAESAQISITKSAKMLWKAIPYRNLLFAWAAGFSAFAISIPFSVITIKNGYGISDHYALIFTLILLGGGLFSTLINGTLADRVGPRPLILIYMTGFFFVAGYWCIAPPTFLLIPVGLVFFIAGLCKTGLIVGLSHYFLSIVEERHRVGISLFTRMCGGAAAGLLGSFGGGTVLKVLESSALTGLDMYKTYFRVVLIVLVPLFIIVLQLRRLKEWKVRHILGLLFSIRDMRAMWVMNRIENSQNVNTDVDHLMRLGKIGSRLSESTLRSYLDSPVFSVRIHALQSLRHIDFGEKTVQALIYELQRGQFTSAWVAADILGEHGIKDAVPELRKKLTSSDPFLKGKCMVALTRLQDTASYPDIVKIFINHTNPRVAIHGAHALVEMNEKAHIGLLLEKACMENIQEEVLNEILISLATLCDAGELFYQFLREYERDKKEGIMFIDKILADSKIGTSLVFSEDLYSSSSVPLEKMQHLLSVIPHRDKIPLEHVRRFINTCFYTTIHAKVYFCIVTIVAKP